MQTVRCSTAVDALRIDRDDFLQLVSQEPNLKQSIETTGRNRLCKVSSISSAISGRLSDASAAQHDRRSLSRSAFKKVI